jgi:hypothetical protein
MIEEALRRMELVRVEMEREIESKRQENARLRAQLQENRRNNAAEQENVNPATTATLERE